MTARQRCSATALYPPGTVLLPPGDSGLRWQERALCAQTDPDAFFPGKGGSTSEPKKVCRACPVTAECLEYALRTDQRYGVWGGLSERQRRKIKRQRDADAQQQAAQTTLPCSICQEHKPVSEFPKPRSTNVTNARICKGCVAAKNRRITVSQLDEIRVRRAAGEPLAKVAAAYGVSHGCVSKLLRGVTQPAPDRAPDNASGDTDVPGKVAA
jgi:WhiB family transcriptional regulator, redox-sensing transcriptional regulator